jgi:hypothetical protein
MKRCAVGRCRDSLAFNQKVTLNGNTHILGEHRSDNLLDVHLTLYRQIGSNKKQENDRQKHET